MSTSSLLWELTLDKLIVFFFPWIPKICYSSEGPFDIVWYYKGLVHLPDSTLGPVTASILYPAPPYMFHTNRQTNFVHKSGIRVPITFGLSMVLPHSTVEARHRPRLPWLLLSGAEINCNRARRNSAFTSKFWKKGAGIPGSGKWLIGLAY